MQRGQYELKMKQERMLGRGLDLVTPSVWSPGRPVVFILRGMRKHEKILSKKVKFTDITGCCFENRPWRVRCWDRQDKSGNWATLGESFVMCQKWGDNSWKG